MPDVLPRAPKKSFPKKGKPGRLAKTNMRKSGCIVITLALPSASMGSRRKKEQFESPTLD